MRLHRHPPPPSYGGGREGESLIRDSDMTKIMISARSDGETGAFPLSASPRHAREVILGMKDLL
jgi:hypothetical protein